MSIQTAAATESSLRGAHWRQTSMGILRIAFGVVWAIDASFKWRPGFVEGFTGYLSDALQGQPHAIQVWIQFWLDVIGTDPYVFARIMAVSETLLAIALILGLLTNLACTGGAIMSLLIWSTAEGFGGPYVPGSTDIGTSIIYVLVFAALFLSSAGAYVGLDRCLAPTLGPFAFLASQPSATATSGGELPRAESSQTGHGE